MRIVFRLGFWALLGLLTFVTLSPIEMRPEVGPANVERALAYAAFGTLGALAYPRQRLAILAFVVVAAGLLEAGQNLSATRHGRIDDFLVKAASGAAGWLAASVLAALALRPKAG